MTEITSRLSAALADRYRLERHLGEGGMATVYLAHDVKHDRKVAVKVLKPELAAILGGERFLNEIKVTANLQHPNILALYDSGRADSYLYYVMPHVEGESLRQKMDREKQLSVEEVIELTRAVAGALQYAHEQGIVHRDIKPENILLQRGQPLVADFGIALAVSHAGGTRLTETGLSVGTPHYMSPEQATGDRELDARSDVYSLAAVAYELLTGEPPHHGKSVQAIVARILSDDPEPIRKHRPSVPEHVDAAVRKALDKTPADRFSGAQKFAEALTNPSLTRAGPPAARPGSASPPVRRSVATRALAAVAVVATVLAAWGWLRSTRGGTAPVIRYRQLSRSLDATQDYGTNFAVSPDGNVLVWAGYAPTGERFGLWVQRRSQLESTPLPGGDDAHQPFFSPDGTRVGFITLTRALRVASLGGEPTVTLVDSGVVRGGGTWGTDGFIYVTGGDVGINVASPTGLARIPESGGRLEVVTELDTANGEVAHHFPLALPGGHGVLFVISRKSLYSAEDMEIGVVDLAAGTHRTLLRGVQVSWSPTGHILVVQADGRLVAAPFDAERLELTGPAISLLDGVRVDVLGTADLALSADGRLVYGAGGASASSLAWEGVWVGRDGGFAPIDSSWSGPFTDLSLSPNGSMMALQVGVEPNADVWVKQLDRGPFSRLTFDGGFSGRPAWTADGRSVLYLSNRGTGAVKPYVKRADGSGEGTLVADVAVTEAEFSKDGRWLVYGASPDAPNPGIYALRVGQDTTPTLLMPRQYGESGIRLSPDGRWLAYTSLESGRQEVYVRPFPDAASARWQVSVNGGSLPRWSPDTRELFYLAPDPNRLIAVRVGDGPVFAAEGERTLFRLDGSLTPNSLVVAPDGSRFGMIRVPGETGTNARELVVVENYFEELKARTGK